MIQPRVCLKYSKPTLDSVSIQWLFHITVLFHISRLQCQSNLKFGNYASRHLSNVISRHSKTCCHSMTFPNTPNLVSKAWNPRQEGVNKKLHSASVVDKRLNEYSFMTENDSLIKQSFNLSCDYKKLLYNSLLKITTGEEEVWVEHTWGLVKWILWPNMY